MRTKMALFYIFLALLNQFLIPKLQVIVSFVSQVKLRLHNY